MTQSSVLKRGSRNYNLHFSENVYHLNYHVRLALSLLHAEIWSFLYGAFSTCIRPGRPPKWRDFRKHRRRRWHSNACLAQGPFRQEIIKWSHFTRLVIEAARAIGIAGIVRLSADLVLSIEASEHAFRKGRV